MSWPARHPALFPPNWSSVGLLIAFLAVPQARLSSAQIDMSGRAMGTQEQTPPDKLPAPKKMSGIGTVQMKITATLEAQMWFNQGLNLLHDFWDYESARAFEQAIRVDPRCAMCYWGLYEAESFYHGTARGYADAALDKALSIKRHVSKRERLYIEATAASRDALKNAQSGANSSREVRLWRKLVEKYPKDSEALLFLARHTDQRESLAILQSVLKDDPENSAAHHYYIHALEASEHPEQALHSAEVLPSLAPASGHMVHMPGHIFFRIGDYGRAERAFAASMQIDERYMREQDVQPDYDWNYVHNLMYAIANLMEEGKLKAATELSMRLTGARGELEPTFYTYSTRDSISRLDPGLPVALRTADWAQILELLKAHAPLAALPNLDFLARQLALFAAGMQAVKANDFSKAEESSTRFDAELWRTSEQAKHSPETSAMPGTQPPAGPPKLHLLPDALLQPLLSTLSVMSLELRASLLMAQKHTVDAKSLFAQASLEEKALGYREPPAYIRSVAETEAAALMAIGDWADAKSAYQKALAERPRSGFPLYGMAMCSEKAGDSVAAVKEYAEFLAAWKNADPELTQVIHAQTYVAEHPAAAWLEGPLHPVDSDSRARRLSRASPAPA